MLDTLPALIRGKIEVSDGGCWLWTGALDKRGYGRIRRDRRTQFTHRYVYALLKPSVDIDGLDLDHLCRQVGCCNPSHLEPVTHGVNVARGVGAEVARSRYADHLWCPRNHPLFGDNLYLHHATDKDGRRYWNKQCRICRTDNARKSRHRQAAKRRAVEWSSGT